MGRRLFRIVVLASIGLALGCAEREPVAAPTIETKKPPPVTLKLSEWFAPLRSIQAEVGGQTYDFLFDTAGGLTVIDSELAEAIGCLPEGRVVGFRMTGESAAMSSCGITRIGLGPLSLEAELFVKNFDRPFPPGTKPVRGVVSLHTLQRSAITLRMGAGQLVIETPESLAERVQHMVEVRTHQARQGGGVALDLFVEIAGPNRPLLFELDSGYWGPAPLPQHSQELLGVELPSEEPTVVPFAIEGLGAVEMEVLDEEIVYDGVLNAKAMEQLIITTDLANNRTWLARETKSE
jgi:hypothetical protein